MVLFERFTLAFVVPLPMLAEVRPADQGSTVGTEAQVLPIVLKDIVKDDEL